MSLRPHIVREGDTPLRLAVMYSVSLAKIATHPKNQGIWEAFTRHCLPLGAVIYIPVEPKLLPVQSGQSNTFKATVPLHQLQIRFEDGKGPLANEPYELHEIEPDPIVGKLDGLGRLERDVPLFIDRARIVFPKRHVEHVIFIGHLAPPDQEPGCEARLLHLGYLPVAQLEGEPFAFNDREARSNAISAMQVAFGLNQTGFADAATQRDLVVRHGEEPWPPPT